MRDTLRTLCDGVREEVRTAQGWTLDLELEWKGHTASIEVDGPHHFVRDSHTPTGATAYKRRSLRDFGISLLPVPYFEWAPLRSHEERRSLATPTPFPTSTPTSTPTLNPPPPPSRGAPLVYLSRKALLTKARPARVTTPRRNHPRSYLSRKLDQLVLASSWTSRCLDELSLSASERQLLAEADADADADAADADDDDADADADGAVDVRANFESLARAALGRPEP